MEHYFEKRGSKLDYVKVIREYIKLLMRTDLLETPRKNLFQQLLSSLFPTKTKIISKYISGEETTVIFRSKEKQTLGHMDVYFGDLIIEFEQALPANMDEAKQQLREYTASVWNEEKEHRKYTCIATDGIYWQTFTPQLLNDNEVRSENIELIEKEKINLVDSSESIEGFYHWLNRVFFREGNLKPTTEDFTADFGINSVIYSYLFPKIESAYDTVSNYSEIELAFSEWSKYLHYTYGEVKATKGLFLRHTYLSVLARFIAWAAIEDNPNISTSHTALIKSILSGTYFKKKKIENFVERDFFHWVTLPEIAKRLENHWLSLLDWLLTYDLSLVEGDLLKGVYQDLVDPEDRHDLGEYYTPDWLCSYIVDEVVGDFKGIPSIIDPTCGSGSFLKESN